MIGILPGGDYPIFSGRPVISVLSRLPITRDLEPSGSSQPQYSGRHSPLRTRQQQFAEAFNTLDRHNSPNPQAAQDLSAWARRPHLLRLNPHRVSVVAPLRFHTGMSGQKVMRE